MDAISNLWNRRDTLNTTIVDNLTHHHHHNNNNNNNDGSSSYESIMKQSLSDIIEHYLSMELDIITDHAYRQSSSTNNNARRTAIQSLISHPTFHLIQQSIRDASPHISSSTPHRVTKSNKASKSISLFSLLDSSPPLPTTITTGRDITIHHKNHPTDKKELCHLFHCIEDIDDLLSDGLQWSHDIYPLLKQLLFDNSSADSVTKMHIYLSKKCRGGDVTHSQIRWDLLENIWRYYVTHCLSSEKIMTDLMDVMIDFFDGEDNAFLTSVKIGEVLHPFIQKQINFLGRVDHGGVWFSALLSRSSMMERERFWIPFINDICQDLMTSSLHVEEEEEGVLMWCHGICLLRTGALYNLISSSSFENAIRHFVHAIEMTLEGYLDDIDVVSAAMEGLEGLLTTTSEKETSREWFWNMLRRLSMVTTIGGEMETLAVITTSVTNIARHLIINATSHPIESSSSVANQWISNLSSHIHSSTQPSQSLVTIYTATVSLALHLLPSTTSHDYARAFHKWMMAHGYHYESLLFLAREGGMAFIDEGAIGLVIALTREDTVIASDIRQHLLTTNHAVAMANDYHSRLMAGISLWNCGIWTREDFHRMMMTSTEDLIYHPLLPQRSREMLWTAMDEMMIDAREEIRVYLWGLIESACWNITVMWVLYTQGRLDRWIENETISRENVVDELSVIIRRIQRRLGWVNVEDGNDDNRVVALVVSSQQPLSSLPKCPLNNVDENTSYSSSSALTCAMETLAQLSPSDLTIMKIRQVFHHLSDSQRITDVNNATQCSLLPIYDNDDLLSRQVSKFLTSLLRHYDVPLPPSSYILHKTDSSSCYPTINYMALIHYTLFTPHHPTTNNTTHILTNPDAQEKLTSFFASSSLSLLCQSFPMIYRQISSHEKNISSVYHVWFHQCFIGVIPFREVLILYGVVSSKMSGDDSGYCWDYMIYYGVVILKRLWEMMRATKGVRMVDITEGDDKGTMGWLFDGEWEDRESGLSVVEMMTDVMRLEERYGEKCRLGVKKLLNDYKLVQ